MPSLEKCLCATPPLQSSFCQ